MTFDVAAARNFLRTHARVIEVRLAELFFDTPTDATPALAALSALAGYRNADGGMGHGLEPDVRAPFSQPLAVDFCFELLDELVEYVGDDELICQIVADTIAATVPYLDSVADADGGIPIVLPTCVGFPRAEHWGNGEFPAGLNPTAGLVARARALGRVDHPWIDRAVAYCQKQLAQPDAVTDAHTALGVLRFYETVPEADREWAGPAYLELGGRLSQLALFQPYPDEGYGLTPLQFAPRPDSPRRRFFPQDALEAHLDALEQGQADDGGWTISWTPPGPAAWLEWRSIQTLNALRTLYAYGRI